MTTQLSMQDTSIFNSLTSAPGALVNISLNKTKVHSKAKKNNKKGVKLLEIQMTYFC
jgi:hypothetical protein